MDLWIRSQDRKKLVKSGYLTIFLSDTNWFIYSDTTTGEPFGVGKYKTEERALEILDEIQDILNPTGLRGSLIGVNQINTYVYQMPKE